jgi:hypothetical protein
MEHVGAVVITVPTIGEEHLSFSASQEQRPIGELFVERSQEPTQLQSGNSPPPQSRANLIVDFT